MVHVFPFSSGMAFNGNYKVGNFKFTLWDMSERQTFLTVLEYSKMMLVEKKVPDMVLLLELFTRPIQRSPEGVRCKFLKGAVKGVGPP